MAMTEKEKPMVEELLKELQRIFIDENTNLLNKKYLKANKERIALKAMKDLATDKRNGTKKLTWSLLFCDIDDLHTLNNTIGYDEADIGIKAIADIISSCMRKNNDHPDTILLPDSSNYKDKVEKAIRIGGDEFIIVLPDCTKEEALLVKERINKKVAEDKETASRGMTLSIGIADTTEIGLPEKIEDRKTVTKFFDDLVKKAAERMKSEKYGDIEKAIVKEIGRVCINLGINLYDSEGKKFLIDILNKNFGNEKEAKKIKS